MLLLIRLNAVRSGGLQCALVGYSRVVSDDVADVADNNHHHHDDDVVVKVTVTYVIYYLTNVLLV